MDSTKAPLFEIEAQSAQAISNVGGDQNVYLDGIRRRSATIGRAAAALGLALTVGGVGLLIATAVQATQRILDDVNGSGLSSDYMRYVPGTWIPMVVLLAVGIILFRFGRLFASR
jgi:hypothetical protein